MLAWCVGLAATAIVSLMPADRVGTLHGSDKAWHGGTYLLLAIPLCFLFRGVGRAALAAAGLALFGTALECGQLFVPGRSFEWGDILANSMGATAGFLVSLLIHKSLLLARATNS